MSAAKILCLGAGDGWHSSQLRQASEACGARIEFASYESLRSRIDAGCAQHVCSAGSIDDYDVILTRTMPAGSLEQVTFRLAILHDIDSRANTTVINSPRGLEIAIDKFATLAHIATLGYSVPDTIVAQSRAEALDAFDLLGGDCVVKPIFGGEGRGVMRIRNPELAWTTFSTLDQLDAVMYVQRFVPPGGRDTRLLVIGDQVRAIRRSNEQDFRTNVGSGSSVKAMDPTDEQTEMATRISRSIGLRLAAVDLIDCDDGGQQVLEVNAIPGWKGAQRVTAENIATQIVELLVTDSCSASAACQ